MRMVGNDVYIQRGEDWTLDFSVVTKKGQPFTVLRVWDNPYLAITVAAALYEQPGDYRETYWLDLTNRWVENEDGSMSLSAIKKFTSGDALYISNFAVNEALAQYGDRITMDGGDFDVSNYLFYSDPNSDGNYVYKYVNYTADRDGVIVNEEWIDYEFRVIKQFSTKNWMEQGYLFDVKLLAGESIYEFIARELYTQNTDYDEFDATGGWNDEKTQEYINLIVDETARTNAQYTFDEGMPLMPDYDTKMLILDPTRLYVSVNIQGGVR